jgi:hypothetical protein
MKIPPGVVAVAALLALKLAALAIDSTIRVYLGDSAAYLFGAVDNGRLPDDRSFTYSMLIRGLVRPFDTLDALVRWQTLAGILIALVTWHLLVARLGVRSRVALAAACLLAIEPAQLYYERMVLAETVGLLFFMLFVAAAAAYLASGRAGWLPAVALLGLTAASFRLNYLPVVVVISAVIPILRLLAPSPPARRVLAGHLALALVSVVLTHGAYQQWVAWIFRSPPGYIARTGFMQLGLVMPLVQTRHLVRVGLPADFEKDLHFPLADPDARMRHMWSAGGFVRTLRDRHMAIEPIARPLARMALADDPLGLIRIGVHTVGNYFRGESITHALENDLGRRVIPPEILWTLREIWNYDATGLWAKTTPVSWYFEHTTWFLVGCLLLLLPLAIVNVIWHRHSSQRAQAMLVALVAVGLVIAHVLFVPVAFYRYLHPLPVFVLLNAVAMLSKVR